MFSLFERLLKPTAIPERAEPPPDFGAFFWHFARQAKGLFAALFAAGLLVALLDSTIPVFMGRIVTLITASPPDELFAKFWPHLLGMALVLLIARPFALATQNLIANQAISANVSNRIRWQNHWYVVRQSWAFFQNDFAGRIANRVMQTGPAIRETLVAMLTGVWYIMVYGTTALILLAAADPVLALPVALWFVAPSWALRMFLPPATNPAVKAKIPAQLIHAVRVILLTKHLQGFPCTRIQTQQRWPCNVDSGAGPEPEMIFRGMRRRSKSKRATEDL